MRKFYFPHKYIILNFIRRQAQETFGKKERGKKGVINDVNHPELHRIIGCSRVSSVVSKANLIFLSKYKFIFGVVEMYWWNCTLTCPFSFLFCDLYLFCCIVLLLQKQLFACDLLADQTNYIEKIKFVHILSRLMHVMLMLVFM